MKEKVPKLANSKPLYPLRAELNRCFAKINKEHNPLGFCVL